MSLLGNTGWTGTSNVITGVTATFFLDSDYIFVPISNPTQKNYVYANVQLLAEAPDKFIGNISTTIMRNTKQGLTGMTGNGTVPLPQYTYNLAFAGSTADVQHPADSNPTSLVTSLWTYSSINKSAAVNGLTINMQAIDANGFYINNNGLTGATGAYYAVRVTTDTNLYYGNININCMKIS